MAGNLTDKTAIVTGSSTGIGKRIATRFAEEGGTVVTNSRALDRAEETADEIRDRGGESLAIAADVTDPDDVSRLVNRTVDEFGGLDVMVNNAGTHLGKPVLELDLEEWKHVLNVNLTGVFLGSQAAASVMVDHGEGGAILNVSSIYGETAKQCIAPYNASKAGVNNLTRSLAVEFAEYDIMVNGLAPGYIRTPMDDQSLVEDEADLDWPHAGYTKDHIRNRTPLDRYGTTDEMAACAVFLVSQDNFVTGEILHADGGWSAFGWGSRGT